MGTVVIEYLLGRETADDWIWKLIEKKLDTLQAAGLGSSVANEVNLEGIDRDDSDDFSDNDSFAALLRESSDKENSLNVSTHSKSLSDIMSPKNSRKSQDHNQER